MLDGGQEMAAPRYRGRVCEDQREVSCLEAHLRTITPHIDDSGPPPLPGKRKPIVITQASRRPELPDALRPPSVQEALRHSRAPAPPTANRIFAEDQGGQTLIRYCTCGPLFARESAPDFDLNYCSEKLYGSRLGGEGRFGEFS